MKASQNLFKFANALMYKCINPGWCINPEPLQVSV